MLYAGESMRVTTRLMQAASWLLVQRAVHDGDMEPDDAPQRAAIVWAPRKSAWARRRRHRGLLPAALRDLLARSDNLYRRIARLDDVLFGEASRAGRPARRRSWTRWSRPSARRRVRVEPAKQKKAAAGTALFEFGCEVAFSALHESRRTSC